MPQSDVTLADFDQQIIVEYNVTVNDLVNIHRYLQAMQGHLEEGTWYEICLGGYYGTSALLHEVVELRILLSRDPALLSRSIREIKALARSPANRDAHVQGLEAEYRYLQQTIRQVFQIHIDVGALVKTNTKRPGDWEDMFDTELPFFDPTESDRQRAKTLLNRLRHMDKMERG